MKKIYLSLGSNMGEPKRNLEEALKYLREKIKILKISSLYETEPVGYKEQSWFLNIVLEGLTSLAPKELLDFCQGIERKMKRVKKVRFGPRTIDVDILLYEGYESAEEELTVPHPRMKERNFVMLPLYEIAPELVIQGDSIKNILEHIKGEQIRKLGDEYHGKDQ